MKNLVRSSFNHPLISGSSIMIVGTFIANLVNYIFNLSMGRLLTVEEYGLLTSLSSLFILLGIFNIAFINIVAKFSARASVKKDKSELKSLLSFSFKSVGIFSISLLLFLFLVSSQISSFLHITNNILILLISLSIFFSLLYSIPAGVLQGYLKFITYALLTILQPAGKLVFALILVLIGWQVVGAVTGVFVGTLIASVVAYIILFKNYYPKNTKEAQKDYFVIVKKYSFHFLLASLGITLLSNADILLVRHYFTEIQSGHYAALSLMGKAIFYLTMPVNFVFFPLIAQKIERKENVTPTLFLTLGFVALASSIAATIYFVAPNLILQIFFPIESYKEISNLLGPYSIYILLFSLAFILNNFFLSIGKTGVYKISLSVAIFQLFLISTFHNSLTQVITVLTVTSCILLVVLLAYYYRYGRD